MSAKIFEVGDVLPATTQLKLGETNPSFAYLGGSGQIKTDNNNFLFADYFVSFPPMNFYINGEQVMSEFYDNGYVIIDTSSWGLAKRTVSSVSGIFIDTGIPCMTWEDVTPEPTVYPNTKEVAFRGDGVKFNRINAYKAIDGVWHKMSGIANVSYDITQTGSVLQIDDAPATQDGSVLTIE